MKQRQIATCLCFILLSHTSVCASAQGVLVNSIGMEFIKIPSGRFTAGAFQPPYPVPDDTVKGAKRPLNMYMGEGRSYNAEEFALAKALATRDRREGFVVKIKRPFYIGKYEVTQKQWTTVMGSNPSTFTIDGDNHPVENVTWADAQAFIKKLNELDSQFSYRLPTEFEWEYAARAGAGDDIPWSLIDKSANLNKTHTLEVGQKEPNAWGLYDMLGNVWEWTSDYYNEKLFADRRPSKRGSEHVLKGASFAGDVKNATYMTHAAGPANGWDVGFRIILETK